MKRSAFAPPSPFPPAVHAARRERLLASAPGTVFVLPAAPELIRSRDTALPYRQDSDLLYLTGYPEPEAVALLTPLDGAHRLTLFVRPRDAAAERWTGARVGVDAARERFAADAAFPLSEMEERLPRLLADADAVAYRFGSDPRLDRVVRSALDEVRRGRARSGTGPLTLHDPDLFLPALRLRKDAAEIARLRDAARITAEAHREAIRRVAPGVGEWEIQATVEHAFRLAGGSSPAFPTIVASGENATVLHHTSNDRLVQDGDLVLIDAGAEYGGYAGDVTRTVPANGRFDPAQRAAYELVLAAQEAAIARIRPGATLGEVHDAAVRTLVRGLVELGVLRGEVDALVEQGGYKPYYMHRSSHWLGLDVHDVGEYVHGGGDVPLEPGMVFTVEPGVYVAADADAPPELQGIGIRIEDDVVVTEDGYEILTRDVPVAADAIEALVGTALSR